VGFSPPYFYHRRLRERLARYKGPAQVVAGAQDGFVPPAYASAYAEELEGAQLHVVERAGNSIIVEQPAEAARLLETMINGRHK
jgi:pimeloyl-ACP methyl ester carboxylesterase